jgi:hypothetical protein
MRVDDAIGDKQAAAEQRVVLGDGGVGEEAAWLTKQGEGGHGDNERALAEEEVGDGAAQTHVVFYLQQLVGGGAIPGQSVT